ncbi:zinc finger protein 658B-like isoform X1 [Schistocerca gregaria]|uniref:zinc finger protein 658B-like isoform X1 n=2 Tax=Schistocerca gregaria TaxID=7010 RepID=UPI00211E9D60|nr:zinc finger protein 658B-like isoform X1 [Schistocerca gregaria]
MTFDPVYVKTEILSPNSEEISPVPSSSGSAADDSVRVKQEMIFLPESVDMKTEEESPKDEEVLPGGGQLGSRSDPLDKEHASLGARHYENASSPSSWSFRLLEVNHETDCTDRTTRSLHPDVIYPEQCGTLGSPRRDCDESDPFVTDSASDPLGNDVPRGNETRVAERFSCAHCEKTFFSRYCITKHVFSHEPGVPAPASICELCGDVFPDAAGLSRHVADRGCEDRGGGEGGAEGGARDAGPRRAELPPVSQIRPFACRACGATFARLGHLKVHLTIHADDRPHACDVCGKRFRQSVHLTIHKRLHSDERPYGCEVCGKAFRQSVHLQIHLRQHTGYRPFSCDVCGRTFTDRTGLNRHKAVHSRDHPFACDACGRSFRDEGGLRDHRAHNACAAGPFSCDKCGRSFADPFALKRHLRVHESKKRKPCDVCGDGGAGGRACRHDKPYVCKVCGRDFARASSLKRHVTVHTVARTFECASCRRRFKWESSLCAHKCGLDTTPKQFSCDVCGKRFRFRHNAEAHRKVHTGESTHSCEVCGKLCNSAANLRSHYTVHSEERPYTCETCGKGFRRSGNLVAHRKTHLTGGRDSTLCPVSFDTAIHVREHASSSLAAPPLPDDSSAFSSALFYECTVCRSSFTDAISYWRHVGEHSGNPKVGVPDSCGGHSAATYAALPGASSEAGLDRDTQPVNSAFTCEPEMVIPVGPEIVNMY